MNNWLQEFVRQADDIDSFFVEKMKQFVAQFIDLQKQYISKNMDLDLLHVFEPEFVPQNIGDSPNRIIMVDNELENQEIRQSYLVQVKKKPSEGFNTAE